MMKILIFPYSNESSIEIIKSLRGLDFLEIYTSHLNENHAGFGYINKKYFFKLDRDNDADYGLGESALKQLFNFIEEKNIDYVFITNCNVLKILYTYMLETRMEYIPRFLIPNAYNLKYCIYKNYLYENLRDICPKIFTKGDIETIKNTSTEFNIVKNYFVKPIFGSSGNDCFLTTNYEICSQDNAFFKNKIICEYLPGKEYTVDCLCDGIGQLIDFNIRERISTRNGITDVGKSINDYNLKIEINRLLLEITSKITLPYIWFAQFKEDENGNPKLIEINARVSGSFCITKENRKDYILQLIHLLNKDNVNVINYNNASNTKIVRHFNVLETEKRAYVVDIDGTICTETNGQFHLAKPIYDNIKKINNLFDNGAKITYFTSRGMKQCNNDVAKVYEIFFDMTKNQLISWGAKYDSLILGKPIGIPIDNDALTCANLGE